VEGARVEITIEAHTGLEKGVGTLDAVANERGQLLAAVPIRDGKEMPRGVRKFLETSLEVSFPARAGVDTRLRLPVFFVVVETLGPVGRR
jgi:hypothetical protein